MKCRGSSEMEDGGGTNDIIARRKMRDYHSVLGGCGRYIHLKFGDTVQLTSIRLPELERQVKCNQKLAF